MNSIHANIALAVSRIVGEDLRQRDELAAVIRPCLKDRQRIQIRLFNDLLRIPTIDLLSTNSKDPRKQWLRCAIDLHWFRRHRFFNEMDQSLAEFTWCRLYREL